MTTAAHASATASPQSPATTLQHADPAPANSTSPLQATCRYAGKKCNNMRAFKRNGSLHNLCHYHRVRANQNQRRMELRRRMKRTREDHAAGVMLPTYLPMPEATGAYSAALLSSDVVPPSANWPHFDALLPAPSMPLLPAPLPLHDSLSDLFTAPPREHYVVDLPYMHKQIATPFQQEYLLPPVLPMEDPLFAPLDKMRFASPLPLHYPAVHHERRDVVWCDQELVL